MHSRYFCFITGAFCGAFLVIIIWSFNANSSKPSPSGMEKQFACTSVAGAKENLLKMNVLKAYNPDHEEFFKEYETRQNEMITKNEPVCEGK